MRVDEVVIREFLHTSYPRLVAAVASSFVTNIQQSSAIPSRVTSEAMTSTT